MINQHYLKKCLNQKRKKNLRMRKTLNKWKMERLRVTKRRRIRVKRRINNNLQPPKSSKKIKRQRHSKLARAYRRSVS